VQQQRLPRVQQQRVMFYLEKRRFKDLGRVTTRKVNSHLVLIGVVAKTKQKNS